MAGGLVAHREVPPEPLDVVSHALGGLEKRAVRHQERAREVVGQGEARKPACFTAGQVGALCEAADLRVGLEQCELRRQLVGALTRQQVRRDGQHTHALVVVAVQRAPFGVRLGHGESDAVLASEAIGDRERCLAGPQLHLVGDALGQLVELGNVVVACVEEVANLLVRKQRQALRLRQAVLADAALERLCAL